MTALEKKKIELELMRVTAARCDLEIRCEEMKQEIERLEGHIATQLKKEEELKEKLQG